MRTEEKNIFKIGSMCDRLQVTSHFLLGVIDEVFGRWKNKTIEKRMKKFRLCSVVEIKIKLSGIKWVNVTSEKWVCLSVLLLCFCNLVRWFRPIFFFSRNQTQIMMCFKSTFSQLYWTKLIPLLWGRKTSCNFNRKTFQIFTNLLALFLWPDENSLKVSFTCQAGCRKLWRKIVLCCLSQIDFNVPR